MFRADPGKRARGALRKFYEVAPPRPETPLGELDLLAVDVETTGLRPRRDQLVSVGWMPVNGGEIDLSGAGYVVLRGSEGFTVGSSAVIHQLTDDEIAAGVDHPSALSRLLGALRGRALLAHFANMEMGFLSHACREHFGAKLEVPVVDTFALERRRLERLSAYPRGEELRLARVRDRYGLPRYANHNAATDALACAELYLALSSRSPESTLQDLQL